MKRKLIWVILPLFLLITGFGLWKVNKDIYPIWNSNSINVTASEPLSSDNVKIEFGIAATSINRGTDAEVLKNRGFYTVVYDGGSEQNILNEYGENDFLVTYNEEYYLTFRQFKFNRKNQHDYNFHFFKKADTLFVHVKINGQDNMEFERSMIPMRLAHKYRCNTPLEDVGTVYNVVEMKK